LIYACERPRGVRPWGYGPASATALFALLSFSIFSVHLFHSSGLLPPGLPLATTRTAVAELRSRKHRPGGDQPVPPSWRRIEAAASWCAEERGRAPPLTIACISDRAGPALRAGPLFLFSVSCLSPARTSGVILPVLSLSFPFHHFLLSSCSASTPPLFILSSTSPTSRSPTVTTTPQRLAGIAPITSSRPRPVPIETRTDDSVIRTVPWAARTGRSCCVLAPLARDTFP